MNNLERRDQTIETDPTVAVAMAIPTTLENLSTIKVDSKLNTY